MYRGPHVDDPKKSVAVVLPLDRYQRCPSGGAELIQPSRLYPPGAAEPYPVPGGGAIRPKFPPGFTGQEFLCPLPPLEYKFPLDLPPAGRYKLSRQRWEKF